MEEIYLFVIHFDERVYFTRTIKSASRGIAFYCSSARNTVVTGDGIKSGRTSFGPRGRVGGCVTTIRVIILF